MREWDYLRIIKIGKMFWLPYEITVGLFFKLKVSFSVNGVLRTSDGYIIITKRAEWVGEHPGMLDTPGGHPEPSAVDPLYDLKVNGQEIFQNVADMHKDKVIRELFKSQQEEMELEFNIERIVV